MLLFTPGTIKLLRRPDYGRRREGFNYFLVCWSTSTYAKWCSTVVLSVIYYLYVVRKGYFLISTVRCYIHHIQSHLKHQCATSIRESIFLQRQNFCFRWFLFHSITYDKCFWSEGSATQKVKHLRRLIEVHKIYINSRCKTLLRHWNMQQSLQAPAQVELSSLKK